MTPKKKPDAKKSKPGKTPKRDWLKIKLEFFKSDYTEL